MKRLTIYFAITVFIGLVLAVGLIYTQTRRIDDDTLLDVGEEYNSGIGRAINLNHDFQNLDAARLSEQLTQLPLESYTVVQDETVLFSSENVTSFRQNSDSQTAFRQGRAVSTLDGEKVTTYLPVYAPNSDEKIGLAILTSDMSATADQLAKRRSNLTQAVVLSLLILLGVAGVFLVYATQRFEDQNDTLHEQNIALMLQLISRADFSHMSLRALQLAFRKLNPASADANTLRGFQEIEGLAGNLALVEKIERAELEPDKKPFALDELLRERAQQFRESEVSVAGSSGLGLIADRSMVAHAIDAMLHNINHHNTRERAIKLSSESNGTLTRITAALPIAENIDTLPPIDPNQHIDLTVARLMIESHGGNLEFNYQDGIQFSIVIPSA